MPGTRFRLEPWGKMGTSPSEEQLELYHQAGGSTPSPWGVPTFSFIPLTRRHRTSITDHQSRGLSLERLEKRVQRYRQFEILLWSMIGMLLAWAFFFPSKYDVQPDRLAKLPLILLELCNPIFLMAMVVMFVFWRHERRDRRLLAKTCQALKEGLPPSPLPWPQPHHGTGA